MRLHIRTMREIIREVAVGSTRPPADAVIAIAEFVGANEKFDPSIIDRYIPHEAVQEPVPALATKASWHVCRGVRPRCVRQRVTVDIAYAQGHR